MHVNLKLIDCPNVIHRCVNISPNRLPSLAYDIGMDGREGHTGAHKKYSQFAKDLVLCNISRRHVYFVNAV